MSWYVGASVPTPRKLVGVPRVVVLRADVYASTDEVGAAPPTTGQLWPRQSHQ